MAFFLVSYDLHKNLDYTRVVKALTNNDGKCLLDNL